MRTTDFSRAPKQGRAEAMVVAEFDRGTAAQVRRNLRSLRWVAGRRRVRGYVWHKAFRRAGMPGVIVFFATVEQATAFRSGLRRTAARTRLLVADPSGYSNGIWRAEGNVMAHIPAFTPTSAEVARGSTFGPPVAPAPQSASRPSRRPAPSPRAVSFSRIGRRIPTTTRDSAGAEAPSRRTSGLRRVVDRLRPVLLGRAVSFGRKNRLIPTKTHDSTNPRLAAAAGDAAAGAAGAATARPVTDARAMFVGATKYRGPSALLQLSRTWYPMVARMQQLRGYVWHTIYWEPPFTLGTLAFFVTRDDLLSFARLPAHRALMQWITRGTRNGTGGYIRLHLAPGEPAAGSADATEAGPNGTADLGPTDTVGARPEPAPNAAPSAGPNAAADGAPTGRAGAAPGAGP